MVQKYSLEAARAKLPNLDDLSKEKREKAMFYLGMMSYINLMTEAQSQSEEQQVIINELMLDEIDTEGLILLHELKA
jgi:hypothetical protein